MSLTKAGVICLSLAIAPALTIEGRHTRAERSTDDTSYTLKPGEARVGIWKVQYSPPLVSGLEIGTYNLPWIGWVFDVSSVNLHAKYNFLERGQWAGSLKLGFFRIHADRIKGGGTSYGFPFELNGSVRLGERFTVTTGLHGTYMRIRGDAEVDEGFLGGVAAANTLQWFSAVEYRLSSLTAFTAFGRLIASNHLSGEADAMYQVDEHTRVEAHGLASVSAPVGAQMGGYVHWSWNVVNLKVGATYGNYVVPGLGLATPMFVHTPIPEFDLFVRF